MNSKGISIPGLDPDRIPGHVAIIMDGNGRWARRQSLERSFGHNEGVGSVHRITQFASDLGVKYLTLYAFSTENWQRPQQEVDILMELIGSSIEKETPELVANNVRIRLLGAIEELPESTRRRLDKGLQATAHCTGLTLTICLSYSGYWEITQAVKALASEAREGKINPAEITAADITSHLPFGDVPAPDLLIRTGGEQRISNFLLWQAAYAELYFTDVLWPDFGNDDFVNAVIDYQHRERRYGMTSDQIRDNIKQ